MYNTEMTPTMTSNETLHPKAQVLRMDSRHPLSKLTEKGIVNRISSADSLTDYYFGA